MNHIVYHGTAYSPAADPWPGWQFYARVEFNPRNSWWADFAALNQYVTRVQSFLQAGTPDQDVLLYSRFTTRSRNAAGPVWRISAARTPPPGYGIRDSRGDAAGGAATATTSSPMRSSALHASVRDGC